VNRNISTLALIVCFAGSLAFAGDKKKSTSPSDAAATSTQDAAYDASKQDNDNPCSDEKKHHKEKKNREKNDKASPSLEQQFDEVLRGIYG
jgi:hypothetical protein